MMYYNTVYHYGLDAFAAMCAECGVDGLIIPDLPYEEQGELKAALENVSGAPILIQLVSPVSKERIPMLTRMQKDLFIVFHRWESQERVLISIKR